ncbi:phospholipase D-like domain-containing protein [Methanobrevibacter arboriphilus]|nr:phospholipase D-like domain-containing protein [Methanobrevibacter arboriphilus]
MFNNHQIFNHSALYAKFYVFDNSNVIITSANLTFSGLNRNYDYGII